MLETWSTTVLDEWRQTYILSMRCLNHLEQRDSIDYCLSLCDKTQPVVTRVCGAYLIGKVAKFFTDANIPLGWAQKVGLAATDFNFEIRNEIATQFKTIFKRLSPKEISNNKIVEKYVETFADEEEDVRCIAIKNLPWVLEKVDSDVVKSAIVPSLI